MGPGADHWGESVLRALGAAWVWLHASGVPLLLGLSIGWAICAVTRWRALQGVLTRNKKRQSADAGADETSPLITARPRLARSANGVAGSGSRQAGAKRPSVAVIMPAKNTGEHLRHNWQSQVLTSYQGRVQSFIVLGSESDPAYTAALQLKEDFKSAADIQIILSGSSQNCSQKIHNQLAGLAAVPPDTDFVFFVDDDVDLPPDTIGLFVEEMQAKPDTFLVTGYPLDIPSNTLASYAAAAFHLPLSIVFATDGRTTFVWGGCMFFRAQALFSNSHGIVSSWSEGGYSDDMTVASVVTSNNKVVRCPGYSLFLQRLPSDSTLQQAWCYLRRQLFACMTYSSLHNLISNQAVMWLHCVLSSILVASAVRSALVVLAASALHFSNQSPAAQAPPFSSTDISITKAHLAALAWCAACLYLAQAMGIRLCWARNNGDAKSYKLGDLLSSALPWRVWAGLFILNAMYPVCALVTFLVPTIEWSGIRYQRKHGKVVVT